MNNKSRFFYILFFGLTACLLVLNLDTLALKIFAIPATKAQLTPNNIEYVESPFSGQPLKVSGFVHRWIREQDTNLGMAVGPWREYFERSNFVRIQFDLNFQGCWQLRTTWGPDGKIIEQKVSSGESRISPPWLKGLKDQEIEQRILNLSSTLWNFVDLSNIGSLVGSDFSSAEFAAVNFGTTDLEGVTFKGAAFFGCDLSLTQNLRAEMLKDAEWTSDTKFPKEIHEEMHAKNMQR